MNDPKDKPVARCQCDAVQNANTQILNEFYHQTVATLVAPSAPLANVLLSRNSSTASSPVVLY
jgi:hypothetical protein